MSEQSLVNIESKASETNLSLLSFLANPDTEDHITKSSRFIK